MLRHRRLLIRRDRICSNSQIGAEWLENEIWEHVRKVVSDPRGLEQEGRDSNQSNALSESLDALDAQRQKLRRGMEHLIDSLTEGVIDRDQFTSRMNRTKSRIADIETKLAAHAAAEERRIHVRSAMSRLAELSTHLQRQLNDADWTTKRDVLRALIQRIEIGPTSIAVVLRLPAQTSARTMEPIVVILSRA